MDAYWAAPPIIRTITAVTVLTSLLVHLGPFSPFPIVFHLPQLLKFPPELWRLVTSFWLTAPKLGLILDPYFLFQHGSNLETKSPRFNRSGDFVVYIIFVQLVIILLNGVIMGGMTFIHALILAFVYTYSQDNLNTKSKIFSFSFPTAYLPYVYLAWTAVTNSPIAAVHEATGIVAAHAYDFLTRIWPTFGGGRNWIQAATPNIVYTWFGGNEREKARGYGFTYRGSAAGPSSPASYNQSAANNVRQAWSSGISGGSWASRGQGHRLGGE